MAGTKGYDPAYGARPLKRAIQKYVQDPLAEMMLEGKIHDGETVKVTRQQGRAVDQRPGREAGGLGIGSPRVAVSHRRGISLSSS